MRSFTLKTLLISGSFLILLSIGLEFIFLIEIYRQESIQPDSNVVKSLYSTMSLSIIGTFLLTVCLVSFMVIIYQSRRLKAWNGIQKEFVNNFMHEFRTPVSVISIASKVLQSEGIESQPARLKQYAGIIKTQTDQLQQKTGQILELAITERRLAKIRKELVDVNELVKTAIAVMQPLIEERDASVAFNQNESAVMIFADGTYLTQAVVNLLDNSLKYAKHPQITVETNVAEKVYTICVKDNGIGMEKKYFKHIFRKYYRIPTGNIHNVKGFGIGLNFVKKVIDAHNGRIEVSSVTGKGTEFRIQLPLT